MYWASDKRTYQTLFIILEIKVSLDEPFLINLKAFDSSPDDYVKPDLIWRETSYMPLRKSLKNAVVGCNPGA